MRRPIDGTPNISSRHGQSTNMGFYGRHLGMDYVLPVGTPVYAPANGTVTRSYISASVGETMEITDDTGKQHRVMHLSWRGLAVGAKITEGQLIAKSGKTGTNITGPHLHWDVRKPGVAWNSGFANFYNPEALIEVPTPPPQTTHPYAKYVGRIIYLKPYVVSWNVYRKGTNVVLGQLKPKANGGLAYIIRGVDNFKPTRVLINSATFGNNISLPVDNDAQIR